MTEAQKIACINKVGFVISFVTETTGARSFPTGNYPVGMIQVIDLATTSFREGLQFWPTVSAVFGKTQSAPEHIVFNMNGQTATYEARNAGFNSCSISLIGG